jgi:hypothetical protein
VLITLEGACAGGAVALLSIYFLDLVGLTTLKPSSRIVLCVVDINGMLPALGICRRVHEQVPRAAVREVFRGLALSRRVHVRGSLMNALTVKLLALASAVPAVATSIIAPATSIITMRLTKGLLLP